MCEQQVTAVSYCGSSCPVAGAVHPAVLSCGLQHPVIILKQSNWHSINYLDHRDADGIELKLQENRKEFGFPLAFSPDLGRMFPRRDKPKNSSLLLKLYLTFSLCRLAFPCIVMQHVALCSWDFSLWVTPKLLVFLAGAPFGDAAHGGRGPALDLRCATLIKCSCFLQKHCPKYLQIPSSPKDFLPFC